MAIKKLSQMIDDGELIINNVQKLDVTPRIDSAELQAAFDENAKNLVAAIDSGIVDGITGEDYASKAYVDQVVIDVGAGDMTKFTYDTNEDGIVNNADHAVTADTATADADGNAFGTTYVKTASIAELILNLAYPVGSIKMTTSNVNPSTYLGGTWAAWGSGRVPVGVSTDTEFDTVEKTGGAKAVNLSHTHAIAARTSGATAPGLPSHYHSVSLTAASNGNHSHTANSNGGHTHAYSMGYYNVGSGSGSTYKYLTFAGSTSAYSTSSAGAHTHSTTTNGAHTHSVSGNTGSSGSGSSHTHSVPAATSAAGGSTAQSVLQPYITCYMWKRTA